jgi:peptide/nickel transport system permease protein
MVFFVGHMVGDPARLMLPPDAKPESVEKLREDLGLNDPLGEQFGRFIGGALRGDFGDSYWQKAPALPLALERLPATLLLAGVVILIAVPVAILLGSIAALRPRSVIDHMVNFLSLGAVSIVDFWLALMLILLFAVKLGWFATSGYGGFRYIMLPVIALAIAPLGRIAQITRSTVLDELSKPYVKMARAKGMPERRVTLTHALKNAFIPIITMSGAALITLLNGAVVIETVFAWPGVGLLLILAVQRRDLPLIEATIFIVGIMVIVVNLVVDLSYAYLNPRIRYGRKQT